MIFGNRKHSAVENRFKIFSFDPILHGVFIYGLPQNPTFKAVVLKRRLKFEKYL